MVAGAVLAALVAGAGPATAGTVGSPEERLDRAGALAEAQESSVVQDPASQQVAAAAGDGALTEGETLGPGETLVSSSGRYGLALGTDGLLALVQQPTRFSAEPVVLAFLAEGQAGARLVMQSDDNLVMYNPDNSVAENFATAGTGAEQLVVQDDRNVVLYGAGGSVVINFDTIPLELLAPGQALLSGDRMITGDRRTTLEMQTDGNLVVYQDGVVRFQSATSAPGADAVLQTDGNFVVYSGSTPVFQTVTGGRPDSETFLFLEPGAFGVLGSREQAVVSLYGSAWQSAVLSPGQTMLAGDRRRSASGSLLLLQEDGNLVQYVGGRAVWQSRTAGSEVAFAVMQEDGNFVLYGLVGDTLGVLFQTRTGGNPGAFLQVPDGRAQFQVRSGAGRVLYPR